MKTVFILCFIIMIGIIPNNYSKSSDEYNKSKPTEKNWSLGILGSAGLGLYNCNFNKNQNINLSFPESGFSMDLVAGIGMNYKSFYSSLSLDYGGAFTPWYNALGSNEKVNMGIDFYIINYKISYRFPISRNWSLLPFIGIGNSLNKLNILDADDNGLISKNNSTVYILGLDYGAGLNDWQFRPYLINNDDIICFNLRFMFIYHSTTYNLKIDEIMFNTEFKTKSYAFYIVISVYRPIFYF